MFNDSAAGVKARIGGLGNGIASNINFPRRLFTNKMINQQARHEGVIAIAPG
jgi:hypothetical protein